MQLKASKAALFDAVVSSAVMCSLWREAGGAPNQVRPPARPDSPPFSQWFRRGSIMASPNRAATGTEPAIRQKIFCCTHLPIERKTTSTRGIVKSPSQEVFSRPPCLRGLRGGLWPHATGSP